MTNQRLTLDELIALPDDDPRNDLPLADILIADDDFDLYND